MPSALPELFCVDPAQVSDFWPHVKHLIRASVEKTGLSDFSQFEAEILAGDQLLWLVWNGQVIGAGATKLVKEGTDLVCIITAMAGVEMKRWVHLEKKIEDFANAEGCASVRIYGRKGWQKVLSGYNVKNVILEKAL